MICYYLIQLQFSYRIQSKILEDIQLQPIDLIEIVYSEMNRYILFRQSNLLVFDKDKSSGMIEKPANRTKINIHPPTLKPKFTNIGYGNPRYNSMLISHDGHPLITCGSTLRKVDLRNNQILLNRQIGHSQIFNIIQNEDFIIIINFQGLISLLNKTNYEVVRQFYAYGKQIRHSSVSAQYIAVSCELYDEQLGYSYLQVYRISDILTENKEGNVLTNVVPYVQKKGHYYYPEIIDQQIVIIQYHDPNPKGRSRVETVMDKKLPVKHKILRANIQSLRTQGPQQICKIAYEGEILCTALNNQVKQIFYLHQSKRLTIFSYENNKHIETTLEVASSPHCVQAYRKGIVYPSKSCQLGYLCVSQNLEPHAQKIILDSVGIGGNFSIKPQEINAENTDYYLFNEYGLHLYCSKTKKTFSQACFDITNCGVSLNQNATLFTVADFGGNVYTFTTQQNNIVPHPITKTTIGIPVRSLVWSHHNNKIIIGCVGGTMYCWDGQQQEAQFVKQYDCTINILKQYDIFVTAGTSDGFVHIIHSETLQQIYSFQAHHPIHYQSEKDRELFGSMKNYAEIWSIAIYPLDKMGEFYVVTASEDQTEKVFHVRASDIGTFTHQQRQHLVGHSLAVTSVDWKNMGKGLNQVYVSCSDDKIVRFRNPEKMFEIVHQLETSTIRQWHTLTYLALQPNGHRVAIGSQNGYLFIFDIEKKELLFGQKIHLGGVQGLDWNHNKLVTCSSDLCISVITL